MKWLFPIAIVLFSCSLWAQENPHFVTYDHYLEEPGNLEISTQSTFGIQGPNYPTFWGQVAEFEYGVKGWWTSSLYLEGARQANDATVFTGFRLENRFKPLKSNHAVNPVLYFEFENVNEASRIAKEVVGHSERSTDMLKDLRGEKARELETKLILSSAVNNWNIAENFIVEKNLTEDEGYEFGYAVGVYRRLSTIASGNRCSLCRENFMVGLEMYGGLGSTEQFGLSNTAHYLAPGVAWNVDGNSTLKVSPGFGLNGNSSRVLLRVGYTYEINGFGRKVAQLFGAR
jgi:hypothetical protein